jgi:hypothetical protein
MDTQNEILIEDEEEEDIPLKFSGTFSPVASRIDGLVKQLEIKDIIIPDFQRKYVWKPKQASRFIESLLLYFPVPSILLSRDPKTKELLVIDGQQRLISIYSFYKGEFPDGKKFNLKLGNNSQFENATYKSLNGADRRNLDGYPITAITVEPKMPDDEGSIFHIFERLNTGGTLLKAQEIRAAIYHGAFNDLLTSLNANDYWREIFGRLDNNKRDQELILRFLALYFNGSNYRNTMKDFLNNYMKDNRNLKIQSESQIRLVFEPTIEAVYRSLGNKAFRPKKELVAAIFDAVMVGIAKRLERGKINNFEEIREWYDYLLNDEDFIAAYATRTSDEGKVRLRLKLSIDAFDSLY